MKIQSRIISSAVVCFLMLTSVVFAQKTSRKDADKKFRELEYFSAIDLYKGSYAKEKNAETKAYMIFQIAECYRHINDLKQAETWYSKAVKAKYSDPIAQYYLAEMMKGNENYAGAIVEFNKYKALVPSDKRGEDGAKSCELAQKWKDNPTRYVVTNEAQINTKNMDFSPTFADKKHNEIYFTSTREGSTGNSTDGTTGEGFSDIYTSKHDKKGKWGAPVPLSAPINTTDNEGSVYLNHKMTMMFFTRCPNEKKKNMACEILFSEKRGNDWTEPKLIPITADSISVGHPALSNDDNTLYFSSDMPGGFGGHDIWSMTWNKKEAKWENLTNCGASINTIGSEYYPYVHEDGTLYFASNGHIGMGGLDIFKAEKSGDKFTGVTNLRSPINSPSDDFGIVFDGKLEKGYFCSNRQGGKGSDDIYSFYLPPLIFAIQGVVRESDTKAVLPNATVKLIGSDGSSVETVTDASGAYKFAEKDQDRYVKANVTYTLFATADKHLNSEKAKVTTVAVEESKTFEQNFELVGIKKPIRLPEILYDLAKWDLKPEFQDSLSGLINTLNDNPNITIELGSHTDSRGDNKSNAILAQKRAQSVGFPSFKRNSRRSYDS